MISFAASVVMQCLAIKERMDMHASSWAENDFRGGMSFGASSSGESIESWQSVSESPDSKKNPEVTESESLSDEISPHSLSESPEPHVNVSQEGSVSASFSFTVLVLWIFSKLVWDSAYPFSISCNVPSYSHEVE